MGNETRKPGRRRRTWKWLVLGTMVLGIAGLLVTRGVRKGSAKPIDKALIATVKRADLEITVLETGRVEPKIQTQVKSKVGGQVTRVTVEEGQKVEAGQVLLHIDPTDYRRDVARMDAEAEQQRHAVAFGSLQLQRAQQAQERRIAPAAELDQARHESAMSKARLRATQVALATARDRLRYTHIEAPFAGTIIQRNIQPGEVVVPGMTATVEGKPLLVLADISTLLVKIDLNQIDVARVKVGQTAEATLDALPGKTFKAVVSRVAAAASAASRDAFQVETALDSSQDLSAIKPGMTADVRILIERRPKVLSLPIEAVVTEKEAPPGKGQGKGTSHVQLIEKQGETSTTTKREVTLGVRNDRDVEILTGLREGDTVMISPPAVKDPKR